MSDTNITVIKGRLTKAAELKYGKNNNAVVTFGIANNESRKNANGEWENIPSFFDCVVFGKYGEAMSKHLKKGRAITITGRLKQDRWENNGQKMSRVTIQIKEIELGAESGNHLDNNQINTPVSDGMEFPPEENPFDNNEPVIY